MLTIARTVPIWTLGRLGLRRVGSGRRWAVLAVADEMWRPGEELVHPVVAVEREAAAQKLQEVLRARGVDQDAELRAAIARFVDAFAAAFVEGGLPG